MKELPVSNARSIARAAPVEIPVAGGGAFPVRRIYCVGRNYEAHAREMGFEADRDEPIFFTKPADAIVLDGASIPYPRMTANYHHEVELVLALGAGGNEIPVDAAAAHLFGYAVGLDMTRRDLQLAARQQGLPWDMSKAFDHSAPCGTITPVGAAGEIGQAGIRLSVNGEVRQSSSIAQLIWSIDEIIHWLSRYVDLAEGDLIYTGTPEGVGPVVAGDVLHASVDGLPPLTVSIV
jgi:fumarylpyruvate hydrolase